MKVIWHDTVAQLMRHRRQLSLHLVDEKLVVLVFLKERTSVITAVVEVKNEVGEVSGGEHRAKLAKSLIGCIFRWRSRRSSSDVSTAQQSSFAGK